jgi:hypothetical protein
MISNTSHLSDSRADEFENTYSQKSDNELVNLATLRDSLRDVARQALDAEIRKRGLDDTSVAAYKAGQIEGFERRQEPTKGEKAEGCQPKSARWLYLWLYAMLTAFAFSLSVSVFLFVSNSVFPLGSEPPLPNMAVIVGMLIGMAAEWKAILKREPETSGLFRKKHRRVVLFVGIALVALFSAVGIWGYKNGHDRTKTHLIEAFIGDMASAGRAATKVNEIRGRDLRTTQDYVNAYEELDVPLKDWRANVEKASAELDEVRTIGLTGKAVLALNGDDEFLSLAMQRIELIEKQVAVARKMATLPNDAQIAFWEENFKPLLDEDDNLMAKVAKLQQKVKEQ